MAKGRKKIENDILSPKTWPLFKSQNHHDGTTMVFGYAQGISDVIKFVKTLPPDLTAEEFKEQILKLCERGQVLTNDVNNKLTRVPSWLENTP